MSQIRVVSLLGQNYSFRVGVEESALFQQAEVRLKDQVAQAQQRASGSGHQDILVAAALSLAVTASQQAEQLAQSQQRLTALVESLTKRQNS